MTFLLWNHGLVDYDVGRLGYHGADLKDVAVVCYRLTGCQPVSGCLELVVFASVRLRLVVFASVRLRVVQCFVAESAQACLLMLFWQTIVSVVPGDDDPDPDPDLVFVLVSCLAGSVTWIVVWTVVLVVVWTRPSAFLLLLLLRCR